MQPLFSTKERELILDYLLDNPNEEINMNALARKLGVSPSQVHHYLGILKKEGLFKNKKLVDNAITRSLRVVKNLSKIKKSQIIKRIRKKFPRVRGVGVYGSWANGTNRKGSDLDLWIKIDKDLSDLDLAKINKELSKRMEVSVEVLVATPERMEHLRKNVESLYYSLFNSITIWGESL
ncbi:MAG: nucleotidyltransferase domain-containing protein [Candidatus Diapherotrites archaeon]|nr:nucleotidyltransferase domain-containing protein [Candidatus Diapherotrites archaeon]